MVKYEHHNSFSVAGYLKKLTTSATDSDRSNERSNNLEITRTPRRKAKAQYMIEKYAKWKLRVRFPRILKFEDTGVDNVELYNFLKGSPHMVSLPNHWSSKKKYLKAIGSLNSKPYVIPEIISSSEIFHNWNLFLEKNKTLKDKLKARRYPKNDKMKLSIEEATDKILDSNFRTSLLDYGDIVCQEWHTKSVYKKMRPGILSLDLKEALSLHTNAPPPWIFMMQEYGPPPEYLNHKIPGVNSAIPQDTKWGYEPNGWGKFTAICEEHAQGIESKDIFIAYDDNIENTILLDLNITSEGIEEPNKMTFSRETGNFQQME